MPKEAVTLRDLICYQDERIAIFTPNIHKAGGTIFVYLHKATGDCLVIDAGLGFDQVRTSPQDGATERYSTTDQLILKLLQRQHSRGSKIWGVITQGHLDHIFDADNLAKRLGINWICSATTQAMVERKISYHQADNNQAKAKFDCRLITDDFGQFQLRPFIISYYPSVHSIKETYSLAISTVDGFHGLHQAEFRVTECSLDAGLSDKMFHGISNNASDRPYQVVLYDALRNDPGVAPSEDVIWEPIKAILKQSEFGPEGALIIPFISSKFNQVAIIQELANRSDCLMLPAGRAMKEVTEYGRQRGWIAPQSSRPGRRYSRLVQPCTGSQSEPGSALVRALSGSSRDLCLLPNDWVLVIQTVIPQYRGSVASMYRQILDRCGRLVIGRAEARKLGLDRKQPKILPIENLIGRRFTPSSGHGFIGDQKKLKAAAPCLNDNYIGYQSEEDVVVERETVEADLPLVDLERLRRQLLTIVNP